MRVLSVESYSSKLSYETSGMKPELPALPRLGCVVTVISFACFNVCSARPLLSKVLLLTVMLHLAFPLRIITSPAFVTVPGRWRSLTMIKSLEA